MLFSAWLGAAMTFFDGSPKAPVALLPDRNPVLLVHGIADNERNMRWLAHYLRREGLEVHTMNLTPNWGQKGLEPLAAQIDAYAKQEFGGRKFDLVGFSMGGLVSRYYVQRMGGLQRVDHLVTLSAPHQGTALAGFSHLTSNLGMQQMKRGSAFISDLDRDADQLRRIKFTSLYTPFDLVILPPTSSVMPQARNIRIPAVGHPFMIFDGRSLRAVGEALRG